jgi:hypothetical protein
MDELNNLFQRLTLESNNIDDLTNKINDLTLSDNEDVNNIINRIDNIVINKDKLIIDMKDKTQHIIYFHIGYCGMNNRLDHKPNWIY